MNNEHTHPSTKRPEMIKGATCDWEMEPEVLTIPDIAKRILGQELCSSNSVSSAVSLHEGKSKTGPTARLSCFHLINLTFLTSFFLEKEF